MSLLLLLDISLLQYLFKYHLFRSSEGGYLRPGSARVVHLPLSIAVCGQRVQTQPFSTLGQINSAQHYKRQKQPAVAANMPSEHHAADKNACPTERNHTLYTVITFFLLYKVVF